MHTDELEKLVRVSVCADGLMATLCVQPGVDLSQVTMETVSAILEGRGVSSPADLRDRVDGLVAKLTECSDQEVELVIAQGTAAIHGEDGWFELDGSLEVKEAPQGEDENGEIENSDHYARSAFIVVTEGQHVGQIHPHTEAQDGVDVRGKVIKAKAGRPCKILFDETVRVDEHGSVTALQSGRLDLSPTRLRIDPVLVVAESVDFSTGNVDFPHDVLVQKGVRDCFTIEAGGAIEIVELVEAASVNAGGSILLRRGMAGRGKGCIHAGGDLEAKYLDAVRVDVLNDLRVQRELTNCTTYVGRCVRSPSCSVVGGKLDIRFGGQLRMLGGEAEGETLVRLGIDPTLERQARDLEELVPVALNRATQAKLELDQLKKMSSKLSPSQAEAVMSLQFEIMTCETRFPVIKSGIQSVVETYKRLSRVTLAVEKAIMPGVTIVIGGKAATVREPIRGPVVVALDEAETLVLRDPSTGAESPIAAKAKLHPATGAIDISELERWLDNPLLREERAAA